MWDGFDAETRKQLATIKELTGLSRQTPTQEWPLVFIEEHKVLFVVREWPNGTLTAYTCEKDSGEKDSSSAGDST